MHSSMYHSVGFTEWWYETLHTQVPSACRTTWACFRLNTSISCNVHVKTQYHLLSNVASIHDGNQGIKFRFYPEGMHLPCKDAWLEVQPMAITLASGGFLQEFLVGV